MSKLLGGYANHEHRQVLTSKTCSFGFSVSKFRTFLHISNFRFFSSSNLTGPPRFMVIEELCLKIVDFGANLCGSQVARVEEAVVAYVLSEVDVRPASNLLKPPAVWIACSIICKRLRCFMYKDQDSLFSYIKLLLGRLLALERVTIKASGACDADQRIEIAKGGDIVRTGLPKSRTGLRGSHNVRRSTYKEAPVEASTLKGISIAKDSIQVSLRLPCYDFTLVEDPTVVCANKTTKSLCGTSGTQKSWVISGLLFHQSSERELLRGGDTH
ncbi:unnamed protein product [Lactuca virosa]|uniref:Uncharacterized protein n=1 Tax=Lactuca virosa TaxID=75947 RepID=A0AAU9NTE3_9ASTR|nr:unnamed protein product [Lactuca virosa]